MSRTFPILIFQLVIYPTPISILISLNIYLYLIPDPPPSDSSSESTLVTHSFVTPIYTLRPSETSTNQSKAQALVGSGPLLRMAEYSSLFGILSFIFKHIQLGTMFYGLSA